MPTKKSSTSESGAFMSQYDQEVEKRLKVLESQSHSHSSSGDVEERVATLETRLNDLISKLEDKMTL